jgi:hypothetical protein
MDFLGWLIGIQATCKHGGQVRTATMTTFGCVPFFNTAYFALQHEFPIEIVMECCNLPAQTGSSFSLDSSNDLTQLVTPPCLQL